MIAHPRRPPRRTLRPQWRKMVRDLRRRRRLYHRPRQCRAATPTSRRLFLVDKATAGRAYRTRAEVHAYLCVRSPRIRVRGCRDRRGCGSWRDRRRPRTDQGLVRRGAAADRGQYVGRGDPRLRTRQCLGERAASVRSRHPRFPGDRIHARRHGGRDHGDEEPRLPRVLGDRQRPRPQARRMLGRAR